MNKFSRSESLTSNGRLVTNNVFLSSEVGNCTEDKIIELNISLLSISFPQWLKSVLSDRRSKLASKYRRLTQHSYSPPPPPPRMVNRRLLYPTLPSLVFCQVALSIAKRASDIMTQTRLRQTNRKGGGFSLNTF